MLSAKKIIFETMDEVRNICFCSVRILVLLNTYFDFETLILFFKLLSARIKFIFKNLMVSKLSN